MPKMKMRAPMEGSPGSAQPDGLDVPRLSRGMLLTLLAMLLTFAMAGSAAAAPLTSSSSQSAPDSVIRAAGTPPAVTRNPVSTTVVEGHSASFEAEATGSPAPTVKWERSTNSGSTWAGIVGGTSDVLTIATTKVTESGYEYRATFTNSAGKATSLVATLTVGKPPTVTEQPASKTTTEGHAVFIESAATGAPEPSVQWEVSTDGGTEWNPIPGATFSPLIISSAKLTQSGNEYRAVFTNALGKTASNPATLTVYGLADITRYPASTTVEEGQSASFEATATGTPEPTIRWERSTDEGNTWTVVAGATSDVLNIASTKISEDGQEYRAAFTNVAGTVTSPPATLSVHKAPAITKQPVATAANEGQPAVFEASASGYPAPTAQWEHSTDGGSTWAPIEGATSPVLTIASTSYSEDGYEYRAVFTNAAGSATTAAAALTVHSPPVITAQPASTTVELGQEVSFEAAASGFPEPTVQWELSTDAGSTWSSIAGANSDKFTISATTLAENNHEYRAAFTNVAGTRTSNAATLTVATNHYAAVGWGRNVDGQLGNGSTGAYIDVPTLVSGVKFVSSVAAGGRHSLALLANGTVLAWGDNEDLQLGEEGVGLRNVPEPVPGLSGVTAIAAGANHSLALLSNGTVMAWGENESGQLGDGNTTEASLPVAVKGLTNVKAIAAGGNFSLALLDDGTVMAWGDNEEGQLGTGGTKPSTVPVAVKGLSKVAGISAGSEFSLAVLDDGTVDAWGSAAYGELGTEPGEEEEGGNATSPVPVPSLTGVEQVSAGFSHSLALLTNGTVMAWGQDTDGQVGNGVITKSEHEPVPVSGLTGVSAVSAGTDDSVARLANGTVMTWGVNVSGTLGDGTTGAPSDVPVAVNGLSKVADVSAGGYHMLAFGEPIPSVTHLSPATGPLGGGNKVTITGVNLGGAVSVKFGTQAATGITANTATSVTATAPAGTGVVDVTVTTEAGTSGTGPADRYTYASAPAVKSVSPNTGPATGHTPVTITGEGFAGVSGVSFAGVPALEFKVNSPTSITAVSPPGASGTADVRVDGSGGESAISRRDHFKYAPVVDALSPNTGPTTAGTHVTITGTGFALGTATTFKFGKTKAKSVECTSTTTCTVSAPAGTAGTVDVIATAGKVAGQANPPGDQYTYG
jgi:alpha-tubulin suppressor-like RCC1 family protein